MASVYSIVHRASKREYVGMTSKPVRVRWQHHTAGARAGRPGCTKLMRALAKYGPESFDFKVIATVPTFEEAQIGEMLAIAVRRPEFNLTAGGDGHRAPHADSTRQKMSAVAKARGRRPPPHVGTQAAVKVHRGAKRPPEWRAAMSAAQRRRFGPERTPEEKKAWQKAYYAENRVSILEAKTAERRAAGVVARPARPWAKSSALALLRLGMRTGDVVAATGIDRSTVWRLSKCL